MTVETATAPDTAGADRARVRAWHAAWLVAMGAAAALFPDSRWALGAAAAPGLTGLVLGGPRLGYLQLLIWAAAAGVASAFGGGLTGPLALMALAPLAAACALGGAPKIAAGAALAAADAAAAGLMQASGLAPASLAPSQPWLTLVILAALGLALGGALAIDHARGRRRDHQAALDAARRKAIEAALPFALLRLDAGGRAVEALGELPEGVTPERLAAGLAGLAQDAAPVEAAMALAASQGKAVVGFAPAWAPERWYAAAIARVGDGYAAVVRDASLEHAREFTLEQRAGDAESLNDSKSRFLANMSHELRTPLNAIIGFSDIMRSRMFGPLSDKYAEYAGLIHESGGHLLDLINDVLDMSKIEAHRFELSRDVFDARDSISAALRLMRVQADAARIHLRGVLPPRPLEVEADPRALKQIVLNLVSNALKFTGASGQVTVTLRGQGKDIDIVVSDTGVGIAPEDLDRLGKPYEQAGGAEQRARGTGLGLSLVRALAELHGGEMSIESVLGEGTAVAVRLPVLLDEEADEPPAAPSLGGNVVAFAPQR